MDLIELNEAFAAQALAVMREWKFGQGGQASGHRSPPPDAPRDTRTWGRWWRWRDPLHRTSTSRITAKACRGECLIEFDQIHVGELEPSFPHANSVAGTGPMPLTLGGTPAMPQETSLTSGLRPSSAAFSGWDEAHRGRVVLAAGVPRA